MLARLYANQAGIEISFQGLAKSFGVSHMTYKRTYARFDDAPPSLSNGQFFAAAEFRTYGLIGTDIENAPPKCDFSGRYVVICSSSEELT